MYTLLTKVSHIIVYVYNVKSLQNLCVVPIHYSREVIRYLCAPSDHLHSLSLSPLSLSHTPLLHAYLQKGIVLCLVLAKSSSHCTNAPFTSCIRYLSLPGQRATSFICYRAVQNVDVLVLLFICLLVGIQPVSPCFYPWHQCTVNMLVLVISVHLR